MFRQISLPIKLLIYTVGLLVFTSSGYSAKHGSRHRHDHAAIAVKKEIPQKNLDIRKIQNAKTIHDKNSGIRKSEIPKESHGKIHIVIVKSEFKLYLYDENTLIHTFPVALGKNSGDKQKRGDCRTPEGRFRVVAIQDSRGWSHDFQDGKGPVKGAYGQWFLRLYTGADATTSGSAWTGIAIHGTHNPKSIGTRASEGCIRLDNQNLETVKLLVRSGTPVLIKEKK